MSDYTNEAGEPMMTHSQARLEADLDSQSAMEDRYDDRDDEPNPRDDYDSDEWAAVLRKKEGLTLALLIPTEGDPLYVEIKDYQDLNKYVECSTGTTYVYCTDVSHPRILGCYTWVDDEGLLTNRELNPRASIVMGYPGVIAGHIVIFNSNKEGENIDITDEIIHNVMSSLGLNVDGDDPGYKNEDGKWVNFNFHPDSKFPFFVDGEYC